MDKKKILFVIHALGYGGAGKMIVFLANYMSQQNYDVAIYVEEQMGAHYPINPQIEVIQETKFFKNYYTRHFQQIFQLRKRVKEIKPDLIISFQTNQNALSVLATRGRKIPVIVSERGDPYQYNNFVAKLKTWVINKAEGGVFQTQRAKEYYGKKLQKRSTVIYNPSTVPLIPMPKWEDRKNEIAFVARFDIQQKRQDLLVKAFAEIANQIPEYKLCFYGTGDDETIIKDMVHSFALDDRVVFKGLVNDIPNAIRNSKLFVLTSDYEGMPNALIEAMSVGLPCISTDCSPGGAAELIHNDNNGVIIPCGDVHLIADAIFRMIKSPNEAEQMGKEAQKIVAKLNPDIIYNEWLNYVKEIIR